MVYTRSKFEWSKIFQNHVNQKTINQAKIIQRFGSVDKRQTFPKKNYKNIKLQGVVKMSKQLPRSTRDINIITLRE